MQTSFMHPPFGFALFYLRSVAPTRAYKDKVTGQTIEPVTSGQIYMGAIPYVVLQIIMVGLVIVFPYMVTHYRGDRVEVDPSTITIDVPFGTGQPGDNPFGAPAAPDFGAPAAPGQAPAPGTAPPPPDFGAPAAPGQAPAPGTAPPPPDFGAPPPPDFGAPAPQP
jgi:hypothetical protein